MRYGTGWYMHTQACLPACVQLWQGRMRIGMSSKAFCACITCDVDEGRCCKKNHGTKRPWGSPSLPLVARAEAMERIRGLGEEGFHPYAYTILRSTGFSLLISHSALLPHAERCRRGSLE